MTINFAVIVPMANEAPDFKPFIDAMSNVLDSLGTGNVYLVVDEVSIDNTLELCLSLSEKDGRYRTVWAPDNQNVVDAYICGYRHALKNGHEFIIEMDAGLSHDPSALPLFLDKLEEGIPCVFGSRFVIGGSIYDSSWQRTFLSRFGTQLSNVLLGTRLDDATSGYQGFHANIARKITDYDLLSKAHFYQTEVRYLLRHAKFIEVPIKYRAPSPSVSHKAILNSAYVLSYYFLRRLFSLSPSID